MPDQRILVVDDDSGIVNIITAALTAHGRTFLTASDGVEAVEKVLTESPDLVVLDVMMPKMNGYQVCRLLKNDRSTWDIPVIMLTARDRDSDRMYGLSTGADDFIVKPFHPGDLRAAVERLLPGSAERPRSCPVESPTKLGESSLLTKVNSLLDRKLQEMTFLQEMTRAIVSTFDEERILQLVLDGIKTYLGYERAVIFMADEDGLMAERVSTGFPRREARFTFGVDDPEVVHRLVHLRGPVVLDGVWEKGRFLGGPQAGATSVNALIPIVAREEVRGVVLVDRRDGGAPFSQERTGVLNTMAGQLGLALDNARLYRTTLVMSITDGLTGLFNARYFYDRLETEISRARRYGRPLTLFMLDIDYFKAFNDNFGHLTGDEALRRLAGILKESIREPDTAARYGGEEFCIILPETDAAHAALLAERIRKEVEAARIEVGPDKAPESLTVSVGCASLEEDVESPEDLVRRADRALYQAKQLGRNRVFFYAPGLR